MNLTQRVDFPKTESLHSYPNRTSALSGNSFLRSLHSLHFLPPPTSLLQVQFVSFPHPPAIDVASTFPPSPAAPQAFFSPSAVVAALVPPLISHLCFVLTQLTLRNALIHAAFEVRIAQHVLHRRSIARDQSQQSTQQMNP